MITDVTIDNLRGVKRGELHGLRPLTVLTGPNGSGKSTVLLAIENAHPNARTALLDSPECGLDPQALQKRARELRTLAFGGRQVVLITYSLEFIDYLFFDAAEDELDKMALVRLSLRDGILAAVTVPGRAVRGLREDIDEDPR